jgi:hypothetical protein
MRKSCFFLAVLFLLSGLIATSCIPLNYPPSTENTTPTAVPTPPAAQAPISTPAPAPPATTTTAPTEAPILSSQEAAALEFRRVQDGVKVMMRNNNLTELINPVLVSTNDMRRFPDDTTRHGVVGVGYVLSCHDFNGDGTPDTNYILFDSTKGTYICDKFGNVTQVTTGYE